jgi:4-hydroxybenzoate polyprenyltransferase
VTRAEPGARAATGSGTADPTRTTRTPGTAGAARTSTGLREIVVASRPFSWINTAYPFAAAYLVATGGRVDAALVVGTLYFLIPYNLLMYGVNDVFDYASDLRNPRKGGIEGALADPTTARRTHRRILWACLVVNVPFLAWLLLQGDTAANLTLAVVVFLVVAYSAPVLRFKERPFLDSFTSAMHFVGPALYALVLVGADLGEQSVWPVLAAFTVWGAASHAFGAVQDVRADREAGIGSVATVIGAHRTVVAAAGAYLLAAALLAFLPWPGWLATLLPLPYLVNVLMFWSVRDEDCERANAGWRRFLWLNLVTGFLVTMLLIAATWPA